MELPHELAEPLLDPTRIDDVLDTLPIGLARQFHACTHTTFAPTVVRGGTKINIDPRPRRARDRHPHAAGPDRRRRRGDARRRARRPGRRRRRSSPPPTTRRPLSPIDTPLWDTLARVDQGVLRRQRDRAVAHRRRHRRPLLPPRGRDRLRLRAVQRRHDASRTSRTMFHGDDERVDVESLRLCRPSCGRPLARRPPAACRA